MDYTENHKCAKCGAGGRLEQHHIYTRGAYPNLIDCEQNKIWVCRKCHREFFHGKTKPEVFKWLYEKFPERMEYLDSIKNIVKYKSK